MLRFAFLLIALAFRTALAAPASGEASPWWGHVRALAADESQGRLTGSPGYRKAAEYVAHTLASEGAKPAGTDGYFQSVEFEVQVINNERSKVQLINASGVATDISPAVVASPGVLQRGDVKARLIFVGYGIHLPEAGYDDFAGVDVRDAIIVYIVGGPATLSGAQRAHAYAEVLPRYLERSGALGSLALTTPKNREVPWARQKAAGAQPGMVLAERALRRYQEPMFAAAYDESQAESLFSGSGHSFAQLAGLASTHRPLPQFPLAAKISAHIETSLSQARSDNVVAELPGKDPALAAQAMVITAHLDHLGTGKPDHGDGIFRGVMDDASGVASLLEIAEAMHKSNYRPRRSILFVAFCGEEKGLLGSRYFAAHPSSHAGHLVADINLDMFLPLYPLRRVVGFGADESSLGGDLRAVGKEMHVEVVHDPQPDHLIFVRADQYSFVRRGIPALMIAMVPAPEAGQQATYANWFSERYHAQADNLDQPVDVEAAQDFDRMAYQLVVRIADDPQPPRWNEDSFFAKFASSPLP